MSIYFKLMGIWGGSTAVIKAAVRGDLFNNNSPTAIPDATSSLVLVKDSPDHGLLQEPSVARFAPSDVKLRLITMFFKHHGDCDSLYQKNTIPQKKMDIAIEAYGNGVAPDEVLLLMDNTVFGSAGDGMIFTENKLLWKDWTSSQQTGSILFSEISTVQLKGNSIFTRKLLINDCALSVPGSWSKNSAIGFANFIDALAKASQ